MLYLIDLPESKHALTDDRLGFVEVSVVTDNF